MIERLRRSMLVHLSGAFAVGFLLLVGGLVLYLKAAMIRTIYTQIDKSLVDATELTLHRLEEDRYPVDKELLDLGDNLFLRVADAAGTTVLESQEMHKMAPAAMFPLAQEPWTWAESPRQGALRTKVITVRYSKGWFQVARDMHSDETVLMEFRRLLRWVLIVTPVVGALMGYALVKAGLRPLRLLAKGASAVGPESLGFRISTTVLPMELDPLSQELNRTFQRLEAGFERLNALNGDLAHELRTPLHSMRLELERLLEGGGLSAELEESLAEMAESGAQMAALIEQMLFLARVEDPSQHLQAQQIDVGHLLEQVRAPFQALAEEKGVRIALQMIGFPMLTGDPILLRRALHNLLANALRHSPAGGGLTLSARGSSHETALEVEDQGPGLPELVRQNVGQRFLRHDPARAKASGGSGLGLAIVSGIAALHGARLEFEAVEPTGCRARLRFPLSAMPHAEPHPGAIIG